MYNPDTNANAASKSRHSRKVELAFAASAVMVIASVPISAAVELPDLPGFALVATGTVASLLALRRTTLLPVKVLVGLTIFMAINVVLHQYFHRSGTAHNWLDPIYVGVVGVYCLLALGVGLKSLFKIGCEKAALFTYQVSILSALCVPVVNQTGQLLSR